MQLRSEDVEHVVSRMPGSVIAAMKSRPGNCFLAGGFIRALVQIGEEPKDIDLFVPSEHAACELAGELFGFDPAGENAGAFKSDNAFTGYAGGLVTQVIHRWTFANPSEVLDDFDFTIAKAVLWWRSGEGPDGGGWDSACDLDFYPDVAAKRLVYKPADPEAEAGGSLLRAFKFASRGYRIPLDSLSRLVSAVARQADPTIADHETLSGRILEILREVDPAPEDNVSIPAYEAG